MKNSRKFAIPTLLAAGLTPLSAQADDSQHTTQQDESWLNQLANMVVSLDESHRFTLAGHRSHQSHQSHQSHRSHSFRLTPGEKAEIMTASASSRNEMSTPPNSILPSSPAIARKLKVLPGNSAKFSEVITQVQIALLARGYEAGTINGDLHARTMAAIYQYQADKNMVPSGKPTNDVLTSLGIVAQ